MGAFLGLDHSFLLVQSGASNSFYRLRNPIEGKSASCCKFARAAIFAAPCDTCCIATTFSVTFQLHCLQLVAFTFCDFAFVSLVCIAQICGGARWWARATRNGPKRTELTIAEDAPSHTAAILCVGARDHIRCAPRASELCQSQCNRCELCALCVLCLGVAHSCSMDSLR